MTNSYDNSEVEIDTLNIRLATLDDLDAITEVEAKCFPAAEAASGESFKNRLTVFADHFWILEEDGNIASVINGLVTDLPTLSDDMYTNTSLHDENGAWQMIFGVVTSPEYQGKGYASKLIEKVIIDCSLQGRKGIVLTCKSNLVSFYEKVGFVNEGESMSKHGGATWFDMRLEM